MNLLTGAMKEQNAPRAPEDDMRFIATIRAKMDGKISSAQLRPFLQPVRKALQTFAFLKTAKSMAVTIKIGMAREEMLFISSLPSRALR